MGFNSKEIIRIFSTVILSNFPYFTFDVFVEIERIHFFFHIVLEMHLVQVKLFNLLNDVQYHHKELMLDNHHLVYLQVQPLSIKFVHHQFNKMK
jgi:hypothetical protein